MLVFKPVRKFVSLDTASGKHVAMMAAVVQNTECPTYAAILRFQDGYVIVNSYVLRLWTSKPTPQRGR